MKPVYVGFIVAGVLFIGILVSGFFVFFGGGFSEIDCQQACLDKGYIDGECKWPSESGDNERNIGSCVIEGSQHCAGRDCKCYCLTKVSGEFCGMSTEFECISDSDCITDGCSGQICRGKVEDAIITTCEWKDCYNAEVYGVECGCVNGKCMWG